MKKAAVTLGFLAATIGTHASAMDEMPYVGTDFSLVNFNTSTSSLNPTAIRVRVGTELSPHLGFEVQGGWGITDDSAPVTGGSLTVELKSFYGAYLRPQYPMGDMASIYGAVGYSWSQISTDSQAPLLQDKDSSESDFSAGVGAEIKVLGNSYLSLDYMQYTEGLTAISAGLRIPL